MPWTETTRADYDRRGGRYASDLTDREWALIEPFMPAARRIGRPRTTDLREVMNAILYMASTGCQWAYLPKDLPPPSTVQRYFYDWRDDGLLKTINHHLTMMAREREGPEASPSAGVIDRRASERHRFKPAGERVKTTEGGGVCGYDAGKKVKGRKRHIVTDTLGLMVGLVAHAADIQDRDGAPMVLKSIRHAFPWLRHVFADGGYAGSKLRSALERIGDWTIEIVKRSDAAKGFEVIPRRVRHCRSDQWRANGSPSSAPRLKAGAGSSPGSADAGGWRRTGRKPSPAPRRGSSSPISGASPDYSQGNDIIRKVSDQMG